MEPPQETAERGTATTEVRRKDDAPPPDAPRAGPPSVRSTTSVASRIKQAQFQAELQLAEVRRREIQLEAEIINKRLEYEIAVIEEEGDIEPESLPADITQLKVDDWLDRRRNAHEPDTDKVGNVRQRQKDARASEMDRGRHLTDSPYVENSNAVKEAVPRDQANKDDTGMVKLALTLEKMMHNRPVPRQALDLPIFSGSPVEWLPFKAAMRDTTRQFNFSKAENLARLRSCLKDEAKEAVSALLYTAVDPEVVMKTLEQCFGRPEMIIDRALDDIKRLPRPGITASELNTFAIKLQNIVCILDNIDNRGYLRNPMLTREVVDKLGPHLRSRWCDYATDYGSYAEPEIVTLSHFLMREADRALQHAYVSYNPTRKNVITETRANVKQRIERKRSTAVYATNDDVINKECLCCGGRHDVPQCDRFKTMTVKQRWEWMKKSGVCFRCANRKHRRLQCDKRDLCGVDGCRHPHHALLHEHRTRPNETEMVASVNHSTDATKVLLKVCPVTIKGPKGSVDTYALLDEGSTVTLIDQDLADQIGADGPTNDLQIRSVNTQTTCETKTVNIKLIATTNKQRFDIKARTMKDLSLNGQTVHNDCLKYAHMKELSNSDVCYGYVKPRILIGADNWHLIVTRRLLQGKRDEPIASLTKLGWVIHGSAPRSSVLMESNTVAVLYVNTPQCATISRTLSPDNELHAMVKKHFEIDSLGITKKERVSPSDARAVELFNTTTKKVNGKYEVRLPWRRDDVTLPPSYESALRRLKSIERKMDKSDEFKRAYTNQIENLFDKRYAEESSESDLTSPHLWYLPHFAVTNPNKPGKLRVVFDAAAEANGVCLNDELLEGPDLLRDLAGLLLRFRERAIAITADIREMFLQVKICKDDQPAQMFLWRGADRTKPPTRYKMTSMIFGAKSSPFLAHSVRDLSAEAHATEYPRAYEAITRNHYMDDYVDCYDTEQEAIETIKEVAKVHAQAGFTLAGYNSNGPCVLRELPAESRDTSPRQLGANSHHQWGRTLGLLWDAATDELAFNTEMVRVHDDVKQMRRAPTKREALSAVMSIFDPLGLLSFYTIRAKIILQGIWRLRIEWDEALPDYEAGEFHEWLNGLKALRSLRLPRRLHTGGVTGKQLHVFCDASEVAYGVAVYWRMKGENGKIRVALAAAKARVAPIKQQSIPRMELQAALIATRLASSVLNEQRWQPERIVYWTDSQTVLKWIINDTVRYTPYVAHRLTEITETTMPSQWRWVPTTHNVADDVTRGKEITKTKDDRWFVGPAFLYENETEWPASDVIDNEHSAESEHCVTHTHMWQSDSGIVPDAKRFSSYERLVRTMANVLLFTQRCRRRASQMTIEHINEAERLLRLWL